MIYKLKDKYYVKISGYLIEVIPFLKDDNLDFKTTENKIEITPDILYKSIGNEEIKKELNKTSKVHNEKTSFQLKKISEPTHKFNHKD